MGAGPGSLWVSVNSMLCENYPHPVFHYMYGQPYELGSELKANKAGWYKTALTGCIRFKVTLNNLHNVRYLL